MKGGIWEQLRAYAIGSQPELPSQLANPGIPAMNCHTKGTNQQLSHWQYSWKRRREGLDGGRRGRWEREDREGRREGESGWSWEGGVKHWGPKHNLINHQCPCHATRTTLESIGTWNNSSCACAKYHHVLTPGKSLVLFDSFVKSMKLLLTAVNINNNIQIFFIFVRK